MRVSMTDSIRAACDEIAGVLLRDGTSVVSYDTIRMRDLDRGGVVEAVGLHVTADRDIPASAPNADDPIDHYAGECWQEVWYAFNAPGEPVSVQNAMRVA